MVSRYESVNRQKCRQTALSNGKISCPRSGNHIEITNQTTCRDPSLHQLSAYCAHM